MLSKVLTSLDEFITGKLCWLLLLILTCMKFELKLLTSQKFYQVENILYNAVLILVVKSIARKKDLMHHGDNQFIEAHSLIHQVTCQLR